MCIYFDVLPEAIKNSSFIGYPLLDFCHSLPLCSHKIQ
uniref:Uncharacterized protein n=1 Tax=Anguilla anguilla TaxID=7936 RepID=A0A0E9S5P6_ANGAN